MQGDAGLLLPALCYACLETNSMVLALEGPRGPRKSGLCCQQGPYLYPEDIPPSSTRGRVHCIVGPGFCSEAVVTWFSPQGHTWLLSVCSAGR